MIANGWSPSDVGTAAPLAASLGGSVLYANTGSLGAPTVDALKELKPSEVILVGGTKVLTKAVETELGKVVPNVPVSRLAGKDRIDTAAKAALRALGRTVPTVTDTGAATEATTEGALSKWVVTVDGVDYVHLRLRAGTDIRPGVWQAPYHVNHCVYGSIDGDPDTLGGRYAPGYSVATTVGSIAIGSTFKQLVREEQFALREGDVVSLVQSLKDSDAYCTIAHQQD